MMITNDIWNTWWRQWQWWDELPVISLPGTVLGRIRSRCFPSCSCARLSSDARRQPWPLSPSPSPQRSCSCRGWTLAPRSEAASAESAHKHLTQLYTQLTRRSKRRISSYLSNVCLLNNFLFLKYTLPLVLLAINGFCLTLLQRYWPFELWQRVGQCTQLFLEASALKGCCIQIQDM